VLFPHRLEAQSFEQKSELARRQAVITDLEARVTASQHQYEAELKAARVLEQSKATAMEARAAQVQDRLTSMQDRAQELEQQLVQEQEALSEYQKQIARYQWTEISMDTIFRRVHGSSQPSMSLMYTQAA